MTPAGTIDVRIRVDTSALDAAVRRVAQATARMGKSMSEMGKRMSAIGGEFSARLTAPIGLLGAAVLKMSGDFEQGMNLVKVLTRELGSTETQIDSLSDRARELGATTQYSAGQVTEAMSFMAMAGNDAQKIYTGIGAVLNLAAAGQMDLARAADIVTNVMASQGQTADELENSVNVLAKAFTSANTDLSMLGQAFKYAGPITKAAGVEFEDATAALALMGNAGIQASMAGTSLRMALLRLAKAGNLSELDKTMAKLGVEAKTAEGKVRPLADILDDLRNAGAGIGDYANIFDSRAAAAMSFLAENTDALRGMASELKNVGDVAGNIARTRMEGLNGSIRRMKSAFEGLAISIGESGVAGAVADFFEGAARWFAALSKTNPELLKLGAIIAGLVAAIGPLLLVLGTVVWSLGQLTIAAGAAVAVLGSGAGLTAVIVGLTAAALLFVAQGDAMVQSHKAQDNAVRDLVTAMNVYESALLAVSAARDEDKAAREAELDDTRQMARARLDEAKALLMVAKAKAEAADARVRSSGGRDSAIAMQSVAGQRVAKLEGQIAEAENAFAVEDTKRKVNDWLAGKVKEFTAFVAGKKSGAMAAPADPVTSAAGPSEYDTASADIVAGGRAQIAEWGRLAEAAEGGAVALRKAEIANDLLSQGMKESDGRFAGLVEELYTASAALDFVQDQMQRQAQSEGALNAIFGQDGDIEATMRMIDALNRGEEAYRREVIRQQLVRQGVIATASGMQGLIDVLRGVEKAYDEAGQHARFWEDMGAAPIDALKNAIASGEDDIDIILRDMGQRFKQALLQELVYNPMDELAKELAVGLKNAFDGAFKGFMSGMGGGSGGFWQAVGSGVASLFGGFRAAGGPVAGGKAYIVGEKGPELFVPSGVGSIKAAGSFGGDGGSFSPVFAPVMNFNGGDVSRADLDGALMMARIEWMASFDSKWDARMSARKRHGESFAPRRK